MHRFQPGEESPKPAKALWKVQRRREQTTLDYSLGLSRRAQGKAHRKGKKQRSEEVTVIIRHGVSVHGFITLLHSKHLCLAGAKRRLQRLSFFGGSWALSRKGLRCLPCSRLSKGNGEGFCLFSFWGRLGNDLGAFLEVQQKSR